MAQLKVREGKGDDEMSTMSWLFGSVGFKFDEVVMGFVGLIRCGQSPLRLPDATLG